MSQENVELARRGMESPDAFWALLDEHVVGDTRDFPLPDFPAIGVGRDLVIEATRRYWGTWDEYRPDVEEFIDGGSSVVVVMHERGRGKGSGVPIERHWAHTLTFHRGRIIWWAWFPDKGAALEAIGLRG
jgi:ketosteroid isomerase-like protein